MSKKQLNLIYASRNGETIHISKVESGLACGCTCPACGEQLVAKKGSKMMHHFAHHTGHTCEFGYETSIHLAAKEIISKAKRFVIPELFLEFPNSYKKKQLLSVAEEIAVDEVRLEQRYGDVIPDIVIVSGGKELFIEIFVTHRIDDNKLEKIKKSNISTIEIDLSKQEDSISEVELAEVLLNDSQLKIWKHNAVAQRYLQRFYSVSDKRKVVHRGFAMHVDDCPLKLREWKGKPYANFMDDCLSCDYCISFEWQNCVFCSGRLRISTLEDFSTPEEKRIKDSDDVISKNKENAIMAGTCPNCGRKLISRQGKHGSFVGCSSYPHCRFTAKIDPKTGEIKI